MLVQNLFVAHQLLVCCCSVSRYEHAAELAQPVEAALMRNLRQVVIEPGIKYNNQPDISSQYFLS